MKLNDQQIGLITGAVDDLFYNFKARLLGRFFKGPFMYFEVANENDPKTSIEGLFRYTIHMLYGSQVSVDENQIKKLAEITSNYIDAQRLKTLNRVLTDAERAKTQKELNDLVSEQMDKATSYMNLLSNTETTMVRAYAEREGITQLAAQIGVEDPVVCKRGIVDAKTCDNCLKLWHHPDNPFIPKVYRLSELTDGYNTDHRDPKPTVGHTHPHCRHVLSFIPPNYGFSKDGSLEFKGFGYDEFAAQREGVKKSENDICRSEIILKLRDGKGSDCPGCKAGLCHL